MGDNPDALDTFMEENKESPLKSFVAGIEKDIAPVKNAISYPNSSGFVEGNNNKFKLIKRILLAKRNTTCYARGNNKALAFG
jgi:transposase